MLELIKTPPPFLHNVSEQRLYIDFVTLLGGGLLLLHSSYWSPFIVVLFSCLLNIAPLSMTCPVLLLCRLRFAVQRLFKLHAHAPIINGFPFLKVLSFVMNIIHCGCSRVSHFVINCKYHAIKYTWWWWSCDLVSLHYYQHPALQLLQHLTVLLFFVTFSNATPHSFITVRALLIVNTLLQCCETTEPRWYQMQLVATILWQFVEAVRMSSPVNILLLLRPPGTYKTVSRTLSVYEFNSEWLAATSSIAMYSVPEVGVVGGQCSAITAAGATTLHPSTVTVTLASPSSSSSHRWSEVQWMSEWVSP